MDMVSLVNHEIAKLWDKWETQLREIDRNFKVPLVYPDLKKDALLFIGINPAYSLKGFRKAVKDSAYSGEDPMKFYRWHNHKKFEHEIEKYREIHQLAREKLDFFKKSKKIAEAIFPEGMSKWEHIDLFFYHETSQKDFERKILNDKDMKPFVSSQLNLSKNLINYLCPKAIVVANALASKLFREEFNLNLNSLDDKHGCYMVEVNRHTTPVFLAGMITGQHAMDECSFERLKWHIKKVLKDMNEI